MQRRISPQLAALLSHQLRRATIYGDHNAPSAGDEGQRAQEQADSVRASLDDRQPQPTPQPQAGPTARPGPPQHVNGWAVAERVLFGDEGPIEAYRSEQARNTHIDEAVRRRAIVQQAFPGDLRAQIAAEANWEEFGKNLSENYGVDVAAGGSTIMHGGQMTVAPKVDQYDDRSGVTTVDAQGRPNTQYTEPRSPTFEEQSQDRQRQRFSVAPGAVVMDDGPTGNAPAGPAAPSPSGAGFSGYPDLQGFIADTVPGARFTSGERSRTQQDALIASGATHAQNSAHLPGGLGQDFVPQAPPDQWQGIADNLMATGRFKKVIVERGGPGQGTGPHIHVEPIVGGGQRPGPPAAGARVVGTNPKPDGGQDAPSGYRFAGNGDLEFIPGGPGDPTRSRAGQRPVPTGPMTHYRDLRQGSRKIDQALEAVAAYPDALGLMNYLGEDFRQRQDPRGVAARASVADIGSLIIHDRSGAAVTVSEAPRLKPFIPLPTDTPEAATTKLRRLKELLEAEASAMESEYSPEQGFRGFAPPPEPTPQPRPGPPNAQPVVDTVEANRRKFEELARRRPAPAGGWSAQRVN